MRSISAPSVGAYCIRPLKNVGSEPIDLSGWTMCSLRAAAHHAGAGVIAASETKDFPAPASRSGATAATDYGALFDTQGQLVSYWQDGS